MAFIPLEKEVEQRVLALLAQEIPYVEIQKQIELDYSRSISTKTITRIKGRNLQLVSELRMTIREHQNATADTILTKTHSMLSQSLQMAQEAALQLHNLKQQYDKGDLSTEEYFTLIGDIKLPSMSELTAVSKAMFEQTKLGQTPPQQSNANLGELLGVTDEITLHEVIFKKGAPTETWLKVDQETTEQT